MRATAPRLANVLRQNGVTGKWVVFSPSRRSRPMQTCNGDAEAGRVRVSQLTVVDAKCPFCEGNEEMVPDVLYSNRWTRVDGAHDELRVVPNKYPAVCPAGEQSPEASEVRRLSATDDANLCIPAVGHHEVVIESLRHNGALGLEAGSSERLLRAWHHRGNALAAADATLQHVMYFKNCGVVAGASLLHPHAQLVALPIVPSPVTQRQDLHVRFFRKTGLCVFDATQLATAAVSDDPTQRVVLENEKFVAMVPYAALSPFNVWVVPKRGEGFGHFEDATPDDLQQCGEILDGALSKIFCALGEPDYNLVLRTPPLRGRFEQRALHADAYTRWYLEVTPRLGAGAMAGFEIGSGMFSNANVPEEDAAVLRAA